MYDNTLSLSLTRSHLRRIVSRFGAGHKASNPNTGGGGCIYGVMVDGVLTPVCIVGQFFASFGMLGLLLKSPLDTIGTTFEPEQEGTCEANFEFWERIERGLNTEIPVEVRQYLRDAQIAQDGGRSWGAAVDYADDMLMWRAANAAAERAGIYDAMREPDTSDVKYNDPVTVEDCQEALAPVNDDGLAEWERELLAADSPF